MKGNEIINHITSDKMPDIQAVRERCLNQPYLANGKRHLRLSTAAAIVAAFLVFTTAAYAVGNMIYQRLDIGGAWDIVMLPNDEYGRQIYYEWAESMFLTAMVIYDSSATNTWNILQEDVQAVREMLAGKIFNAEGVEIDIINARGTTLYNKEGYAISAIFLFSTYLDRKPTSVSILTEVELAAGRPVFTYEEIVDTIGRDFNIPTIHTEIFQPPEFVFHVIDQWSWSIRVGFTVRELTNRFDSCFNQMVVNIENTRCEYSGALWRRYYLGGEIITHEVAGVTVHEIAGIYTTNPFIWTHDGLVYNFHPSRSFTHAQTMDVIHSMIE